MGSPLPTRTIPGVILLVLGIGFLFDALGVFNFSRMLSQWWPLIIILIGAVGLSSSNTNRTGPLIVIAIGAFLLLGELDLLALNIWALFWPIILIIAGLTIIRGRGLSNEMSGENRLEIYTAFGGTERRLNTKGFEGGNVTALFGGVELDLTQAEPAHNAELNITALFGGVELIVSRDCLVSLNGSPIFGGIEDKSVHPEKPNHLLKVNVTATFGGVEIHN